MIGFMCWDDGLALVSEPAEHAPVEAASEAVAQALRLHGLTVNEWLDLAHRTGVLDDD